MNQILQPIHLESTKPPMPTSNSASGKTRIKISYKGMEEYVGWYGNTPSQTIEDAIRTAFQVSSNTRLLLKDRDGDVVAIANGLPNGAEFKLFTVPSSEDSSNSSSPLVASSSKIGLEITESLSLAEPSGSLNSSTSSPDINMENEQLSSSDNKSNANHSGASNQNFNEIEDDDDDDPRKKRKRRKATEIDRTFKCSMSNCQKVYGSENALKMHMKLKHPDYPYLLTAANPKSSSVIVNNKVLNFNQQQQIQSQLAQFQQQQAAAAAAVNQQSRISTSLLVPGSTRVNLSNLTNNVLSSSGNGNNNIRGLTLPDMDPNEILSLSRQFSNSNNQYERSPDVNSNNNNMKQFHQFSIQELLPMVRKSMEQMNNNNSHNDSFRNLNSLSSQQQKQILHRQKSTLQSLIDNDDEENEFESHPISTKIQSCNNNNSSNSQNILPPIQEIKKSDEKGNLSFLVSNNNDSSPSNKISPEISKELMELCYYAGQGKE